jgi:hypothetical protein
MIMPSVGKDVDVERLEPMVLGSWEYKRVILLWRPDSNL